MGQGPGGEGGSGVKDKKESRPGGCDTRTAGGTAAYGRAAVPDIYSTTSVEGRQIQIKEFLEVEAVAAAVEGADIDWT